MSKDSSSLALGLFVLTSSSILLYKYFTKDSKKRSKNTRLSFTGKHLTTSYDGEYFPPLPDEVVEVLRTSKLCYLATQADGNPHLSLMNFTYSRPDEVIILSTRRNTKKFFQIIDNPKVAILVHDFPNDEVSLYASSKEQKVCEKKKERKQWSITLNGTAEATTDGEPITEKYRELHMENNPDYKQFIIGEDIAVLIIRIDRARMCDVQDRVSYWNAKDGVCCSEG